MNNINYALIASILWDCIKEKLNIIIFSFISFLTILIYVDCAKTLFIEYNIASGKKFGDVFIKSKDELFQKRDGIKKEKGYSQTIWGNKIVMNDQFDLELDFFYNKCGLMVVSILVNV